jgi:methylenetetrahydrofolate dehydrogenase (NADP+) / methenyltetrahydrofolate cyclohydrolase
MTAKIIDGVAVSASIRQELKTRVDALKQRGITPGLAVIVAGDDPASAVYVRNKIRACAAAGFASNVIERPADLSQAEMLDLVARLNADPAVHGILVQLPLPTHIDTSRILHAVSPAKDVDAFHPENVGRLMQGNPRFLPCTPLGIQQLLVRNEIPVAGKHVVVVGRSDIVGKPIAMMLVQRGAGADATVTICHSRTHNLPEVTRVADILIVAIGSAKFIKAEMVKPGATVIDVGMNRTADGLFGDVDFDEVSKIAGHITPVPGGVGPLTVTMLLSNTLKAAQQQQTL